MFTMVMRVLTTALSFLLAPAAMAQSPPQPPIAVQPAAMPQQTLTDGQLDALVSPIALYPDALLSEILMASTYPLEIVEADRWVESNKNLQD